MNNNFDNTSVLMKVILLFFTLLTVRLLMCIFFSFHESFEAIDFNNTLFVIIGASATILSIIFALSQFILQNVSRKYSPKIMDEYENNPETSILFFIYLVIISLSLLCIILKDFLFAHADLVYLIIVSTIIFLFGLTLILLINYIKLMFIYTNPFKYLNSKKKEVISAIRDKKEEATGEGFSILGDISIKSLIDNEDAVTIKGIENLDEILSEYIGVKNDDKKE